MSTADMVTETKIIHLYRKSLLVVQHSNMACLIPWVSKILSDPIDDFLITLNLFMATVFAITNLDSSLHNFEWVLDSRTVFAILEFSSHSFM